MQERYPPSLHDLIPLNLATAAVFRRVYVERICESASSRASAHLDGLAYVISNLVPIFAYEEEGQPVRQLRSAELSSGLFRDGGKALYFLDGRPEITLIGVRAGDIEYVASSLIRSFPIEPPISSRPTGN